MSRVRVVAIRVAAMLSMASLAGPGSASLPEDPPFDGSFDYLYAEANEGGSSGGHAAIRFGPQTYHFQNVDGLLVLERDPTREFLHDYALVNNRTIWSSRVALPQDDAELLRTTFDRRYRTQKRQLDAGAALAEDVALLEAWRRGEELPVPGLGYFPQRDRFTNGEQPSAAIAALHERIRAHYGDDYLERRRDSALEQLDALASEDPAGWAAPPPTRAGEAPAFTSPWGRRYQDIAASIGAIDVLEAAAPVDPTSLIELRGPSGWLDATELERTRRARADLADSLVRLAVSPRPDWGRPFLIGLARLQALDAALVRRRLVVLDVLPEARHTLPYRALAKREDTVREMLVTGRAQVEDARSAWTADTAKTELAQARLEDALGRVHELERAVIEKRALRLRGGSRVPERSGASRTALPRLTSGPRIDAALERVHARRDAYQAGMKQLYRYQLITRNCVSELFHTIEAGLGGSADTSHAVLGGYIDGNRDLSFIPFVSALAVDRSYRVTGQRVIPSYREVQLEQMQREENAAWVAIRESNTWTARSYRRAHRDSAFVFFTDGAPWLRPVFGVVNLTAGVFESLWGLVLLPVDGGDTFVLGLEGALVSLPEIAFWNIRKGSNDWVAPRSQSLDEPVAEASANSVGRPDAQSVEAAAAPRDWSR